MDLLAPDPDPADPARLELEGSRVCDRLRTMPLTRLSGTRPDGGTPAGDAFALAQRLADDTSRAEGRPLRRLPVLPDAAAAHALAVCVNDMLEAVRGLPPGRDRDTLCRSATERLVQLRRSL